MGLSRNYACGVIKHHFTHAPEGHARKGGDEWPSVQGSA